MLISMMICLFVVWKYSVCYNTTYLCRWTLTGVCGYPCRSIWTCIQFWSANVRRSLTTYSYNYLIGYITEILYLRVLIIKVLVMYLVMTHLNIHFLYGVSRKFVLVFSYSYIISIINLFGQLVDRESISMPLFTNLGFGGCLWICWFSTVL